MGFAFGKRGLPQIAQITQNVLPSAKERLPQKHGGTEGFLPSAKKKDGHGLHRFTRIDWPVDFADNKILFSKYAGHPLLPKAKKSV